MSELDLMLDKFNCFNVAGGTRKLSENFYKNIYISEVSSISRLYFQPNNASLQQLMQSLNNFYAKEENSKSFSLDYKNVSMRTNVAAFACNLWHRGKIVSNVTQKGFVKVFLFDYGTTGYIHLSQVKLLLEDFNQFTNLAFRGALSGVQPLSGQHLWDLSVTNQFIKIIYDKTFDLEVVKYHHQDDFYEIILYDEHGNSLNKMLIDSAMARPMNNSRFNIFYPSFQLLEASLIYPNFEERISMFEENGIDFNKFEERYIIRKNVDVEMQLTQIMNDPQFVRIRDALIKKAP